MTKISAADATALRCCPTPPRPKQPCMPRPRRPRLTGNFDNFAEALAEIVDLEPDECVALKDRIKGLVEDYRRRWQPGIGPGRRSVSDRDELIVKLAQAFHDLSGWSMQLQRTVDPDDPDQADYANYPKRYRSGLKIFVIIVLASMK